MKKIARKTTPPKKSKSPSLLEEGNEETKVHPGLKIFFGYSLYKSGLLYRNVVATTHLQKFGLAPSECGILYILSTGSVVNQLALGQELGIDKASMVKIVDKLEKLKVVKREVDPADRRAKRVSLTPKGKAMLEKIKSARNEMEAEVFGKFGKADQEHLRRLIPELLEALMNIKS